MSIIRFLHEYWGAATTITAIVATIAGILIKIWSVKRRPDKPESEKIGHKLGIRIRNLGWKIKPILQILGKRQTRAELVDLVTSIDASMRIIRDILSHHHSILIDLKKETNNPMTQEQIEAYYIRYTRLLIEMIEEVNHKKYKIESRTWEGIKPCHENENIKKRI